MRGSAPIVVAFHNRPYAGMGQLPDELGEPGEPVEVVRFSFDPADRPDADAVAVHLPTCDAAEVRAMPKPAGQLWVAWSLESRPNCRLLDEPELMDRFDLTMTYERTSDVWHPYLDPALVSQIQAVPADVDRAGAPVVWLGSNGRDRSDRASYVGQLMRRVRVDSFGSVLRNQALRIPPGAPARVALYRRYKFVLAFENSFAPDYVTEKVFDALRAGSVPVYRGCDQVAELVPSPDCYIDANQFSSPRELGDFLDHLDRDDTAYARWQQWRQQPYQASFRMSIDRLRDPPLRRLGRAVAERLGRLAPQESERRWRGSGSRRCLGCGRGAAAPDEAHQGEARGAEVVGRVDDLELVAGG